MASGDTKTNQYLDVAANGSRADLPTDTCCETRSQALIRGVAERIMDVEDEVEELKNNPDVVDIVSTYAALEEYDTSHLTDKDVIRVLEDESHDGESTYYRWDASAGEWAYIASVPGASTTLYDTTGTNTDGAMTQLATTSMVFSDPATRRSVRIGSKVIVDEYSTLIGLNNTSASSTRNVMLGQYNKSMGDSTQNVVIGYQSQAGDTNTASFTVSHAVVIGDNAGAPTSSVAFSNLRQSYGVNIGYKATGAQSAVSIGRGATSVGTSSGQGTSGVAIGHSSKNIGQYGVALGAFSSATQKGQFDISTLATSNTYGYNNSQYRLLSGLYDPQTEHDAATKGYVDSLVGDIETALATINNGGA